MKIKTKIDFSSEEFSLFKSNVRNAVEAERARQKSPFSLPSVVGIKLTNRCNLRCSHCYQWNEQGYHQAMTPLEQKADLELSIFRKIISETKEHRSRLYLWGGEPFVHRHIAEILNTLLDDPREVTICTNGHFVNRHLDALSGLGDRLELLIALEGLEKQHDTIRGVGSFQTVIDNINQLVHARKVGTFLGKISVHIVINNENADSLIDLLEFVSKSGASLILLTFPWFISDDTSRKMDDFVDSHFSWLIDSKAQSHSWNAFKYNVDSNLLPTIMAQIEEINSRVWPIKIRYQPALEVDEIRNFVEGDSMTVKSATQCSVLNTRIDFGPTGEATACKFFSEFRVGNMRDSTVKEIWNGNIYEKIRQTFANGLSPACSKCNVLHLQNGSIPLHI